MSNSNVTIADIIRFELTTGVKWPDDVPWPGSILWVSPARIWENILWLFFPVDDNKTIEMSVQRDNTCCISMNHGTLYRARDLLGYEIPIAAAFDKVRQCLVKEVRQ